MKEINGNELLDLLISEETLFENYIINLNTGLVIDINKITLSTHFKNCTFKGTQIEITDLFIDDKKENLHTLSFKECSFEFDLLLINNCYFHFLIFRDINIFPKRVSINGSNINHFEFNNHKNKFSLEITNTTFNITSKIRAISFEKFKIIQCTVYKIFTISKCSFVELEIIFTKFKKYLNFIDNKIINSEFKFNEFKKTNFKKTNFGKKAEFYDNKFNGTTLFEGIQNLENTKFIIRSCNFLKYTYFNHSKLSHLLIDTTTFNEIASFQNTEFNTVEVDRTLFEKSAFFDDMIINNINLCSKRTIRNIKQQLLRTDNKIDYNLYKAYELNAHKLELKEKSFWWFLNKDAIILILSQHFSNNGLNWVKALSLTFIWGFVFYSIFYWGNINDFRVSKIYFNNTEDFLFGYTKYLIPTNIYNPLTQGREYVKSNWISFIIGKIIISIGIFETIKSFRKYKK